MTSLSPSSIVVLEKLWDITWNVQDTAVNDKINETFASFIGTALRAYLCQVKSLAGIFWLAAPASLFMRVRTRCGTREGTPSAYHPSTSICPFAHCHERS